MKVGLDGRVAVVTGAGRGIGRAVALALAQAGAKVAALARTQSEIEETAALIKKSGGAQAFAIDVTDTSGVRRAMEEIEAALGPVYVLDNNSGQLGRIGPFVESDPGEWWRVLDVNVRGVMLCTRAVLPGMMARGCGRIVNIASGLLPHPYLSAYVTSKTALVRFSETLAAETRARGCMSSPSVPAQPARQCRSTRSPRKRAGGGSHGSDASSQRSWMFRWSGPCDLSSTSRLDMPMRCQDGM